MVLLTADHVELWRRAADYHEGRIAVFFGVATSIAFGDGVSPETFDFYTVPQLANGVLLLDRAEAARDMFLGLDPSWEIIFEADPKKFVAPDARQC